MSSSAHTKPAIIAATVCLIGGLVAYFRKNSVASLVGSSFIAVLFTAGALMDAEPGGKKVCLAASLLLTLTMGIRAVKTQKMVPIVVAIGGLGCIGFFAFLGSK